MPSHFLGIYIWKVHFCSVLCSNLDCEIMFFFSNIIQYSLVYSILFLNWLHLNRKLDDSFKCMDSAFFTNMIIWNRVCVGKKTWESKTDLLSNKLSLLPPLVSTLSKKSPVKTGFFSPGLSTCSHQWSPQPYSGFLYCIFHVIIVQCCR